MKKKIFTLILLFIPFIINAEEANFNFHDVFDISSYGLNDAFITKDDNIFSYINNYSNDGEYSAKMFKVDRNGQKLWEKIHGKYYGDRISQIIETSDGNLIAIGEFSKNNVEGLVSNGNSDALIIKYDKDGNIVWQKSWGGSLNEGFGKIFETSNGDFVAIGYFSSTDITDIDNNGQDDVMMVKYDKNGNMLWQKSWGNSDRNSISKAVMNEQDEIICIYNFDGNTIEGLTNNGYIDGMILKFDKNGELIWQKNWGGNNNDFFKEIYLLKTGEFAVFAKTHSNNIKELENENFTGNVLIKYDDNGNIIFQKNINLEYPNVNLPLTIKPLNDGGLIFGSHNDSSALVAKINNDGDVVWKQYYDEEDDEGETQYIKNIIVTERNEVIVGINECFFSEGMDYTTGIEDAVLIKYDKDGNVLWKTKWGGNNTDSINNILLNDYNEVFIITNTISTNIDENFENKFILIRYLLEYELDIAQLEKGNAITKQDGAIGIITPTPNEGYEVDKIIVVDTQGEKVNVISNEDGTYSFPLYSDVKIDVKYKEVLSNPKTGVFDYILFILVGLMTSIIGYIVINYNNSKLEF